MPGNLIWPNDEKGESRTSCDNWSDQRKTAKKKLDGLTKWLNVRRMTDALKVIMNRDAYVMITNPKSRASD